MDMYCVKCRKKTGTEDVKEVRTKNNKRMLKGVCKVCSTRKNRFIAESAIIEGGCFVCLEESS